MQRNRARVFAAPGCAYLPLSQTRVTDVINGHTLTPSRNNIFLQKKRVMVSRGWLEREQEQFRGEAMEGQQEGREKVEVP